MNVQRLATPPASPKRPAPSLRCRLPGCDAQTHEAKPYCQDHIDRLPYVKRVLDDLRARDVEIERALRRGRRGVVPDGFLHGEILRELLVHGARSVRKLAQVLSLDPHVVHAYADLVVRRGEAESRIAAKGQRMLTLVRQPLPANSLAALPAAASVA